MNRIPARAAIALLAVSSAALAACPTEGNAQSGLEDRQRSLAALGAAIEEVKRSPFHRVGRAGAGVDLRTVVSAARPRQADGTTLVTGWVPSSPQEAAQADSSDAGPRRATIAAILGIAAGDLIGLGLAARIDAWPLYLLSPPLTALATSLAGVHPGASILSSLLGTGLGLGAGLITGAAVSRADSSYGAFGWVFISGAIVYYAVRIGVTVGMVRRFERKGGG